MPTEAERSRAKEFRIAGWHWFDAHDLDRVKGQLAHSRPVIFGMPIGQGFVAYRGYGVFRTLEQGAGTNGHAMVLVGYDDTRQAFRVMNSFGREWGDGGYMWLGYDLWRAQVEVGFVTEP